MDVKLLEEGLAFMKKDKPAYVRSLAEDFFNMKSKHSTISKEMIDWAVVITQEATLRAAMELQSTAFSTDQRDEVKKIKIPILLQHGDNDVTSPLPLTAEKTRDLMPDCRLIVYPHQGHGLHISGWEPVTKDLLEFISRNADNPLNG